MSRKASGRPLRFFLLLGVGWIGLRAAMLAGPPDVVQEAVPPAISVQSAEAAVVPVAPDPASSPVLPVAPDVPDPAPVPPVATALPVVPQRTDKPVSSAPLIRRAGRSDPPTIDTPARIIAPTDDVRIARVDTARPSIAPDVPPRTASEVADPPARPQVATMADQARAPDDRWQLGAWAFWRSGSGAAPLATQGGRLGGSQVGARLDYDLTPDWAGRLAPYARITSALDRPASPEAAAGLAWQPSRRVPISLLAERRISLGKGGRNANALFVVGGFGPTPLAQGFHAEAYGQAGMVGFSRRDLVVDGKLALLRAFSRAPLSAGFSLSGGAQPGVSRLDIGPEIRLRLPLPRANARLSAEWRQRVAGQAAPGSGLAVTLASDF
ncbi:MAG: hypothetical protein ABW164_01715 [Sphingobium sp.]